MENNHIIVLWGKFSRLRSSTDDKLVIRPRRNDRHLMSRKFSSCSAYRRLLILSEPLKNDHNECPALSRIRILSLPNGTLKHLWNEWLGKVQHFSMENVWTTVLLVSVRKPNNGDVRFMPYLPTIRSRCTSIEHCDIYNPRLGSSKTFWLSSFPLFRSECFYFALKIFSCISHNLRSFDKIIAENVTNF